MIYSNSYQDLERCERLAKFLAIELQENTAFQELNSSDPTENTLELIVEEMNDLPEIIADCKAAGEAFDELDKTLSQMYALADRAAEYVGDDEQIVRLKLDEEFAGLSKIVARLAGEEYYTGPLLSLKTSQQADSARQILSYLNKARLDFGKRLNEQRRLINEAMGETLKTLGQIAITPGADPFHKISSLLIKMDLAEPEIGGQYLNLGWH